MTDMSPLEEAWRDGWLAGNRWAFSDADEDSIATNPHTKTLVCRWCSLVPATGQAVGDGPSAVSPDRVVDCCADCGNAYGSDFQYYEDIR